MRADARERRKALGANEAAAEFGAQFKLFGQAVENALEFADTPEKCDEALTRLLAQLEELEGRFAELDDFLADIAAKRETVYEALSARRQGLVDARQRRAQAVGEAAGRILDGVPPAASRSSPRWRGAHLLRRRPDGRQAAQLIAELRALGAAVAADELEHAAEDRPRRGAARRARPARPGRRRRRHAAAGRAMPSPSTASRWT